MSVNESMPILAPIPPGSRVGRFIRRHKRFSVEIELDGRGCWAHTNNTGSMLGLLRKNAKVLVSPAANPARKLPWTLERVEIETGFQKYEWAGVNTRMPNLFLKKAFALGLLDFARGYETIRMEAVCGESRLDACITAAGKPPLWVECKNVSLVEDGCAAFPDAESARARKHLLELMERRQAGEGAAMFFLVQRPDCSQFAPADYIDPDYARLFYQALDLGVAMSVRRAVFTAEGAGLGAELAIARPCWK